MISSNVVAFYRPSWDGENCKAVRCEQPKATLKEKEKIAKERREIQEKLKAYDEWREANKLVFSPSWDNEPERSEALATLNGVNILTPGNLSMITAFAGAGKSSLFEAGCSSLFLPKGADTLGLRFGGDKDVYYIDTERSLEDHHDSWKRFARRAGFCPGDKIPYCKWFNIRGLETVKEKRQFVIELIDREDGPDLLLLDGIGDLLHDVNDAEEVTKVISKLSSVAHNRKIGIFLTLHVNPAVNSTKARGVLGSELWRKCQFSGIIKKLEDGVRCLTSDFELGKNRSGRDAITSYFCWSDAEKMHVSCEKPQQNQGTGKLVQEREKIFDIMGLEKHSYMDLVNIISETTGKSVPTAKRRVSEWVETGKILQDENGLYSVQLPDLSEVS